MTCLLISDGSKDDDASLSAASLCVGAGSLMEPNAVEGLAHLAEHMIFKGSAAFPEENNFDKYVKLHGGSSNAETQLEKTVYLFDIQKKNFYGALQRFSQFFVTPLFNEERTKREINLLDSEWMLSKQDDDARYEQLLASLARLGHPMRRFTWGNATSLQINPYEKGIDVHLELHRFFRLNYQAAYMTLTVQSKEQLNVLESWVTTLFGAIRNNGIPAQTFLHLADPLDTPAFRKMYYVVPVKNLRQLQLSWALESQKSFYRTKPLLYVAQLVGDKRDGSVLSVLRRRNWATDMTCGHDDSDQENNSTLTLFKIRLNLTDEGLRNVVGIITVVFEYLKLLRDQGPQPWFWLEIAQSAYNDFLWREEENPQDFVHQMSMRMQSYNPREYITGDGILWEYDYQVITSCVNKLLPDRMNVTVWTKDIERLTSAIPHTEKWFGTSFCVEDFRPEWLQQWQGCQTSTELSLSAPNNFIAHDLELKKNEDSETEDDSPICSTDTMRLWYRPNEKFMTPKAYIGFYMLNSEADLSAKHLCLSDMYLYLVRRIVSEAAHPAELASLRYVIQLAEHGFVLQLHGFSEGIPLLLRTIVDTMSKLNVSDEIYEEVHRQMTDDYYNCALSPKDLNKSLTKALLKSNYYSVLEKMETLPLLNKNLLMAHIEKLYKEIFVEGLVQGNLTSKVALELGLYVTANLNVIPADDNSVTMLKTSVTKVPSGYWLYEIANRNAHDENAVLTTYCQCGQLDARKELFLQLLLLKIDEPYFHKLRSKLMLGYDLHIDHYNVADVSGFMLSISSHASKFESNYVDSRVERFLVRFSASLQSMTQEEFKNLVETLKIKKRLQPRNSQEEFEERWTEVMTSPLLNDSTNDDEVDVLKKLTLRHFKLFSEEMLSPRHCKLKIWVNGNAPKGSTPEVEKEKKKSKSVRLPNNQISHIKQWKKSSHKYTFTRKK